MLIEKGYSASPSVLAEPRGLAPPQTAVPVPLLLPFWPSLASGPAPLVHTVAIAAEAFMNNAG